VLQHALRGDFQLVLCEYILQQARRLIQARFPDYTDPFISVLQASRYELVADPTRKQVSQHKDLVRDTTDVALADIIANVDFLVSEDKDLTVQDKSTAKLRQNLSMMISGTFLREVMGWSSEELEIYWHGVVRRISRP